MGKKKIRTTIAVGEKQVYFISDHYNIIQNKKVEEGTLLNSTNNSVDPYVHHVLKSGEDAF